MEEKLAKMQLEVDELYKRDGLTDEVLEKQVKINTVRNELDLPDTEKLVYKEFVQ